MAPHKGQRLKNLIGIRSGKLVVENFAGYKKYGNRDRPLWNCLCDCGNYTTATSDEIIQKKKRSCGCLQHETRIKNGKKRHINLVGQTIFDWYVKERVEDRISKSGIHAVQYLCICICGEERIVLANTLMSGETHDCGHSRKEKLAQLLTKDITGQKVNEWTVQYKVPNTHPLQWHCVCSCGIEKDILASVLNNDSTVSCGHLRMSHGEYCIYEFLKENNVDFEFDRSVPGLRSPIGGALRIDFKIYKNDTFICAIEYQGEQHYIEVKQGNWKEFGKQQREITDRIKRDYFSKTNIPLYEIHYSKKNEIIIKRLTKILLKHNLIHDNTVPSSQETA